MPEINLFDLPYEVLAKIFFHLKGGEVKNLSETSKRASEFLRNLDPPEMLEVFTTAQKIPLEKAAIFTRYCQTSDLYTTLKQKNESRPDQMSASEMILFAFITDDITTIKSEYLEKAIKSRRLEPAIKENLDIMLAAIKYNEEQDPQKKSANGLHLQTLLKNRSNEAQEIFINLAQAKLAKIDLTDAKLRNANLEKADLLAATLLRADLTNTNLKSAKLSNADLTDAKLQNANLEKADLDAAKLLQADLSNTNLKDANLSKAILIPTTGSTLFTNANLENANLIEIKSLNKCDLTGANLTNINLLPDTAFETPTTLYKALDILQYDLPWSNRGNDLLIEIVKKIMQKLSTQKDEVALPMLNTLVNKPHPVFPNTPSQDTNDNTPSQNTKDSWMVAAVKHTLFSDQVPESIPNDPLSLLKAYRYDVQNRIDLGPPKDRESPKRGG